MLQQEIKLHQFLTPEIQCLCEEVGMDMREEDIKEIALMIEKREPAIAHFLDENPHSFMEVGEEEDWEAINLQLLTVIGWYIVNRCAISKPLSANENKGVYELGLLNQIGQIH